MAKRQWRPPRVMLLLVAVSWPGASSAIENMAVGRFALSTDDTQRVTLEANEAPLADILAELGQQLDIDIKGSSSGNTAITARFKELPLRDALKRLTSNYMAVADESTGRIARIILLPKGDGTRYVPPPRPSVVEPADSPPAEADPAISGSMGGGVDFDPDAAADESESDEDLEDPEESWESGMHEDLRNE